MKNNPVVTIIGAGLAGSEAANICARLGVSVKLYEMKPVKFSPAHHSENFAEFIKSCFKRECHRTSQGRTQKTGFSHNGICR